MAGVGEHGLVHMFVRARDYQTLVARMCVHNSRLRLLYTYLLALYTHTRIACDANDFRFALRSKDPSANDMHDLFTPVSAQVRTHVMCHSKPVGFAICTQGSRA